MASKQESPNLDLLRSSAVLMVLLFHMRLLYGSSERLEPMGHFGVLIFFVHTGLVLMMSMERLGLSGPRLFVTFYVRRCFRIYPLSIVFVVLLFLFQIPPRGWPPAVFQPIGFGQLLSNLALTMNLTYSNPVVVPLWSLPYEVQMYAVLPLLYLFFRRNNSIWTLAAGWGIAVVLGWIVPQALGRLDFVRYAPCFLGSIICFYGKKRVQPRLPGWAFPIAVVALLTMYAMLDRSDGGWIPCLALALLIPAFREIESKKVNFVCSRIARYSYGIYLGHAPLMWLSFFAIDAERYIQVCLFVGLLIVVPVACFHALESPMIRLGNRLATPSRAAERTEAVAA